VKKKSLNKIQKKFKKKNQKKIQKKNPKNNFSPTISNEESWQVITAKGLPYFGHFVQIPDLLFKTRL
jgi:hypothetical protein